MAKQIRLGDAERETLVALERRGGNWTTADRALWDSRHWTLQLMASLSRKGCVQVTGVDTFAITPQGRAVALRLNPSP
jgi:hypothetical protein